MYSFKTEPFKGTPKHFIVNFNANKSEKLKNIKFSGFLRKHTTTFLKI